MVDFGVHNFTDSHRNRLGFSGNDITTPLRPKVQESLCRLADPGLDSSVYQQNRDEFCTPPPASQSLAALSNHLAISNLTMEHCLYVGNISVRADKQEVAEWLSQLGPLQLFEFTVKDKQFRFQGGIAIFSTPTSASCDIPTRPFVIAKRKVKLMELSARKNASTLLAVLLKKQGLSLPQAQLNSSTLKKTYEVSGVSDQKQSIPHNHSPTSSLKDHGGERTGSFVDTYSTTDGLQMCPKIKSTRNHRFNSEGYDSGVVSSAFVADNLQRFFDSSRPLRADAQGKRATTASIDGCKFLVLDNTPGETLMSCSLTLSRCSIPSALINSVGQNHQTENLRFNVLASGESEVRSSRL